MKITRRGILTGLSAAALSAVFPRSTWQGLFGIQPAAAQSLPKLSANFGKGRKVAVIGAGIAGLTSAYELLRAGFDVTVFEAQRRYGGRSLTVRPSDQNYKDWYLANSPFVTADSYCDFVPAEVRGAMVPELRCDFAPVRSGDGYADLYFNAGPGRIATHHTAVLHYCREFGVELIPYILVSETNLLQSDDFNQGKPVQIRQFRYDMRKYLAMIFNESAHLNALSRAELPPNLAASFEQFVNVFGDLSHSVLSKNPAGYVIPPGAGTNAGIPRSDLPLEALLRANDLWFGLLAGTHYDWQLPLLEPAGGMDMIWQAFLKQRIGASELRDRVRLEHHVTGIRYTDDTRSQVSIAFSGREGAGAEAFDYVVMTGKPFVLLQMDMGDVLEDDVPSQLEAVLYDLAGKYGWQAQSRFWEDLDVGIFGGISWTDNQIGQIWYPSSGYNAPTGVLIGAYMIDSNPVDWRGKVYPADNDFKVAVDPTDLPAANRTASRWSEMDHAARTKQALAGGEALHPGFSQNVYRDTGISISWDNQLYQHGLSAWNMPATRPEAYARLIRPIDRAKRVYLAGDSVSYYAGWQEGAVRSAWWTLELIREHVVAQGGAQ